MEPRVGAKIHPWPGESLVGVVYAISGDTARCVAADGFRFEVPLAAIRPDHLEKSLTKPGIARYHTKRGAESAGPGLKSLRIA